MDIRAMGRDGLVNTALVQKVRQLEIESARKDKKIQEMEKINRLQRDRLQECNRRSRQDYARRQARWRKSREISVEWLVAGAVVLVTHTLLFVMGRLLLW